MVLARPLLCGLKLRACSLGEEAQAQAGFHGRLI